MNELEAKCYLTKKGGANNSDHTCIACHADTVIRKEFAAANT